MPKSRLPPPVIIALLSPTVLLAQLCADMLARYPDLSASVESDPVQKLLEVVAYREWPLHALLGAQRLGITSADDYLNIPAAMESDDDLRRRDAVASFGG